jgi:hypothetical protein
MKLVAPAPAVGEYQFSGTLAFYRTKFSKKPLHHRNRSRWVGFLEEMQV